MLSNAFLILALLQCINARIFYPVKPWTGGFIETFSSEAKSYEDLPWNQTHGVGLNWKIFQQTEDSDLKLTLYCPRESIEVCSLLDDYGNIAGVQLSVPSGHLIQNALSDNQMSHFQNRTIGGIPHSTLTIYFVVHRTLWKGGRKRNIKSLGIGLWIQLGNQTIEIPLKEEDLQKQEWKEQSCAESKGTYYLQGPTNVTEACYVPYVPTTHEGMIVGMTFLTPGTCPRPLMKGQIGRITNFISLDDKDVKEIFPNAPACLVELASDKGLCSAHVGFVATPPGNLVRCPGKTLVEKVVEGTKNILGKGISFLKTGKLF